MSALHFGKWKAEPKQLIVLPSSFKGLRNQNGFQHSPCHAWMQSWSQACHRFAGNKAHNCYLDQWSGTSGIEIIRWLASSCVYLFVAYWHQAVTQTNDRLLRQEIDMGLLESGLRPRHIHTAELSLKPLTHWGRVTHICVSKWSSLIQIMDCRLVGAKPLSVPMLAYC